MKLLITGGAGFIGSNFVRNSISNFKLVSEITVIDKLTYAGNLANLDSITKNDSFRFIHGDICDNALVSKIINSVDAVINFAAESHVDKSIINSRDFLHTNILGVHNLLECIVHSKKEIRFVQVSTDEVYGSIDIGSWNEESPILPNSPYSATKASADLLIRSYINTYKIDSIITRCSNNYGPYQHPEKLIPLSILKLLKNEKIPVYGNGLNVRDWLHVDDHCRGIYGALVKGKSGEIYNIGGGTEISNIELIKKIIARMGKNEKLIQFVSDRKGHDFRYSIDWSKIQKEINYAPEIKFEIGLNSTIDWYLETYQDNKLINV